MTKYTPGPWRIGKRRTTIVADYPIEGATNLNAENDVNFFSGYLVCETVAKCNLSLIGAAPEMFEALKSSKCECRDKQKDGVRPLVNKIVCRRCVVISKVEGRG